MTKEMEGNPMTERDVEMGTRHLNRRTVMYPLTNEDPGAGKFTGEEISDMPANVISILPVAPEIGAVNGVGGLRTHAQDEVKTDITAAAGNGVHTGTDVDGVILAVGSPAGRHPLNRRFSIQMNF